MSNSLLQNSDSDRGYYPQNSAKKQRKYISILICCLSALEPKKRIYVRNRVAVFFQSSPANPTRIHCPARLKNQRPFLPRTQFPCVSEYQPCSSFQQHSSSFRKCTVAAREIKVRIIFMLAVVICLPFFILDVD